MNTPWSQSLQSQTMDALRNGKIAPDGKLHVKHKSEGFAHFLAEELIAGKLLLHPKAHGAAVEFNTPEAVPAAGWAID